MAIKQVINADTFKNSSLLYQYKPQFVQLSISPCKMNIKKYISFVLMAFITIAGCKKGSTPSPKDTSKPVTTKPTGSKTGAGVYVIGFTTNANSNSIATYWKDGVAIRLADSTLNSYAYAIAVHDTDVYIAGMVNNEATYWKNGSPVKLAGGTVATGIAISGTDVYATGYTNVNGISTGTYWKNGTPVLFTDNTVEALPCAIAVSGSDVYITGTTRKAGGPGVVTLWKNGIAAELSSNSPSGWAEFYSGIPNMAINGNDVYVTGATQNISGSFIMASYWKNGSSAVQLLGGVSSSFSSGANAVTVSGTDVYMAGFNNGVAMYWKNGSPNVLTNNFQNYEATGITISDNDVYVSGFSGYLTTSAVYWKNGQQVVLSPATSITTGIAVVH
jgi:hypothetical protein